MWGWLYTFIDLLFNALSLAIIIRVLLSWFRLNPYHPLVSFFHQITEPILAPLRRVIPPIGVLDITPLVALVLLEVVHRLLINVLISLFG